MATYKLAYALGGGGARGALQVGAIRALLEAGLWPDVLVGTSAGAINATYLAVHGLTPAGLDSLERAWHDAATADLLPRNLFRLMARMLVRSRVLRTDDRRREFFVAHGLNPTLRFRDLAGPRLIQVAANLTARRMVCYGENPDQGVLEGLLASTAIAPWVDPLHANAGTLVDGGIISNLPIEAALAQGAAAVVALDLSDPNLTEYTSPGQGVLWNQWVQTIEQRQIALEMALAAARGVPVFRLRLCTSPSPPFWDFSRTDELLEEGYRLGRRALEEQPEILELREKRTQSLWQRARRWLEQLSGRGTTG